MLPQVFSVDQYRAVNLRDSAFAAAATSISAGIGLPAGEITFRATPRFKVHGLVERFGNQTLCEFIFGIRGDLADFAAADVPNGPRDARGLRWLGRNQDEQTHEKAHYWTGPIIGFARDNLPIAERMSHCPHLIRSPAAINARASIKLSHNRSRQPHTGPVAYWPEADELERRSERRFAGVRRRQDIDAAKA